MVQKAINTEKQRGKNKNAKWKVDENKQIKQLITGINVKFQ
jgi:hypothetical protein